MIPLLKPYRPDPFRFRPPRFNSWLYGYYHLLNWYLLGPCFKFAKINVSRPDMDHLRRIKPGTSTMIVVNHTNFTDPHFMFELTLWAGLKICWLAGIEPFDQGRGLFGWHLQSVGAFSIDRGILDRFSLETAQNILNEGRYPLVIYPEGEAAYTNKVLQPFYPGAALFALSAAEKHRNSPQPVRIIPMGVAYRFVSNPQVKLTQAITRLHTDLNTDLAQRGRPPLSCPIQPECSLWEQVTQLAEAGLEYLAHDYPLFEPPRGLPLTQRMAALQTYLLQTLCDTYLQKPAPENPDLEELMVLKNKLRSIIARKRFAPPMDELSAVLSHVDTWRKTTETASLAKRDWKQLKQAETRWIGISQEHLPVDKRLKALKKHLTQQIPYAETYQQATPEDLACWEREMNDTRRIKLLALLQADLEREDDTWEGVDETLVKLEIMLISKFRYRGPKAADIRIGEPLDVKDFVAQRAVLSKKQLQDALTAHIRERIADLMTQAVPTVISAKEPVPTG